MVVVRRGGRGVDHRLQEVLEMITTEPWSENVDRMFNAAGSYPGLPIIRKQVEQGVAQLWHGTNGINHCYIVTRLEPEPLEWCCIGAVGHDVCKYGRIMVEEAKRRGIIFRLHVDAIAPDHKALMRLWSKLGFTLSEYVMRAA